MTYKRPTDYWCNDDEQVKIIEAALDLYENEWINEAARSLVKLPIGGEASLRPEGGVWRQVSDVTQRQVAWIDRDARYVAVVSKGREYLLDLPPLPQSQEPSQEKP